MSGDKVGEALAGNATNELKRIASFARGLIALEEVVSKLGSLEQLTREAQQRLDQVRAHEAADKQISAAAIAEFTKKLEELKRQIAEEIAARVTNLARLDGDLAGRRADLEQVSAELAARRAEHATVTKTHAEFVARIGAAAKP